MQQIKIINELVRRGLEFRGEITMEEALQLPGFSETSIKSACNLYSCETLLYFAMRKAPVNGKIGDPKTDCKDILITVDHDNDDSKVHYCLEHCWYIPVMMSDENPHGVYSLELGPDCRINYCSHSCGCCSSTGWSFDEYWDISDTHTMNAFDAVAETKTSLGFLPETCTPYKVSRPGYRN